MNRPALSALCLLLAACTNQPPPASAGPTGNKKTDPAAPLPSSGTAAQPTPPQLAKEGPEKQRKHKPVGMNDRGEVSSIGLEQFFTLHQTGKAMVFDARPSFVHKLGHIPGSINLPKEDCDNAIAAMEDRIRAALNEGKTIVVYCSGFTCPDARTVARHFSSFGHPASIFSGGWNAWQEAGLPTE